MPGQRQYFHHLVGCSNPDRQLPKIPSKNDCVFDFKVANDGPRVEKWSLDEEISVA